MALHLQHTLRTLAPALKDGKSKVILARRWMSEETPVPCIQKKDKCLTVKKCRTGLRIACCPPPQGHSPPCPPPPATCPITCDNYTKFEEKVVPEKISSGAQKCDFKQNLVAVKLGAAKDKRRLDYENEVASRTIDRSHPEDVPYAIKSNRGCENQTETCEPFVCGPNRAPPEPKCISLQPDEDCKIKRSQYIDPCAHQPRTLLEIDRSNQNKVPKESINSIDKVKTVQKCQIKPQSKGITSLIMDKLKIRSNSKTFSSYDESQSKCRPVKPVSPSTPCCPSPLLDRLRTRQPGPCTSTQKQDTKNIHTTIKYRYPQTIVVKETKNNLEKITSNYVTLDAILNERKQLKEIAQGRFMTSELQPAFVTDPISRGQMELVVPSGTDSVHVQLQVSLNKEHMTNCKDNSSNLSKNNPSRCDHSVKDNAPNKVLSKGSEANKSSSWLSLKNLQKKLSRSDNSSSAKKETTSNPASKKPPEVPTRAGSPCGQPKSKSTPSSCILPPKSKPTSSPCDGPVKKPTTPYPGPSPCGQDSKKQNKNSPDSKPPPKKTCCTSSTDTRILNNQLWTILTVPNN